MKEKIQKTIDEFFKLKSEYKVKIEQEKNIKRRIQLQIPNFLTLARPFSLLAILPIAFFGHFGLALGLTGIAALTDFFDGRFARKYNAYSEYGRKLDPICDKIFAVGLSLPILITNPLLILPTILLECGIASISVMSEIRQNHPKSTKLGKAKTWALGIELVSLYLLQVFTNIPMPLIYLIIGMANGMQAATGIQYSYIDYKKEKAKKIPSKVDDTYHEILDHQHSKEVSVEKQKTASKVEDIHQEILEYQHLKETLVKEETKENAKTKTIGTL